MKIKDLPLDTNLQTVGIILPVDVWKKSSLPGYKISKKKPVYLQGWVMGDFFVKIDPKSSKIYPMFWNLIPTDYMEWEIAEK